MSNPNRKTEIKEQRSQAMRDMPKTWANLPRMLLLYPIKLYQKTVSPNLPPDTCQYYPTCSHYGFQAIYKHGAIQGTRMAVSRVVRCNPFSQGGYDPVP